jgi:hypothetical protein
MMNDKKLKETIDAKVFPKVTEELMKRRITDVKYHRLGPTLTHCTIHLDNRFCVTGESACVDPRNYDKDVGETIAYKNAFNKLWELFGFLLAEELYRQEKAHA